MDPSAEPVVDSAPARALDWRRPHPVTIVVEIGRAVRSVILAVLVISGGLLDQSSILEAALIAFPLVGAILRWFTTRYALDDESVHLHHGLIWRSRQVLPRANIQNVSTRAGVLARAVSVVELQISDASATGDISIRYLRTDEADRLATVLRNPTTASGAGPGAPDPSPTGSPGDADPANDPATPPGTDLPSPADGGTPIGAPSSLATAPPPGGPAVSRPPLVAPPFGQLLRTELTSTGSVIVLTVIVVAVATLAAAGLALGIDLADGAMAIEAQLSAGFALLIPVISTATVAIGRLLALGGFRLHADPDRLRIQAGLLTEARITARRERIQQIGVTHQLLHRWLGVEQVTYETADLEGEATLGTRYLAPTAARGTWPDLAREVFGDCQLTEADLRPVSPLAARRIFFRYALGAVPLAAVAFLVWRPAVILVVAWLAVVWWYARVRGGRIGWAVSDDQYLVRTGAINVGLRLVRLDKIQTLWLTASPFQRRLGLASIRVSTAGRGAGGLVTLPDLTRSEAETLLARLAFRAARTPIAETL